MADVQNDKNVQLDLNNPVFQENWLSLDKSERGRVTDTLKKLRQLKQGLAERVTATFRLETCMAIESYDSATPELPRLLPRFPICWTPHPRFK